MSHHHLESPHSNFTIVSIIPYIILNVKYFLSKIANYSIILHFLLFTVFSTELSTTTLRQLLQVVFAMLTMTGQVTMLNISRWTSEGGSYRTIQRFFNTVLPWATLFWVFFRTHLFDPEDVYIIVGDETIKPKNGENTYGLDRFFSSIYGKATELKLM